MLPWILSLHVVAVISWMAGLLYLLRLYVYHAEEKEPIVIDRLKHWEWLLLRRITTPAMIVALISGGSMLWLNPAYFQQPWMHIKLSLVVLMFGVHGMASALRKRLAENPHYRSGKFFRLMNEVPTLLMVGIVIAVIVKPFAR